MRQPKNCDSCRALQGDAFKPFCALGYRNETVRQPSLYKAMLVSVTKPCAPCPKPLTWKDLDRLRGPRGTPVLKE